MPLLDPVMNYCERTDPEFWAEPLNALTNLSFIAAAALLARLYYRLHIAPAKAGAKPTRDIRGLILIILVFVIGIGSALFHTFANRLTLLADVIPIMAFVCYYLFVCLHRFLNWGYTKKFLAIGAVLVSGALLQSVPGEFSFNGSIAYFPCFIAILLVARQAQLMPHPAAKQLFIAAAWLAASLAFRTIDFIVCEDISTGTHFLWHTLNGIVLYVLTKALLTSPINYLHPLPNRVH